MAINDITQKRLSWCLSRTAVLYVVLAVGAAVTINHKQVAQLTLDSLQEIPEYVIRVAAGVERADPVRLRVAVRYYKNFNKLFPELPETLSTLGFCYALLGEEPRAISYYEQALAVAPDLFGAYYNLGVICYRRGEYAKAIRSFRQAVAIPLQAQPRLNDAIIPYQYDLQKELNTRDQERIRDAAIRKSYETSYKYLVRCYLNTKDYLAVLSILEGALKASDSNKGFFYYSCGVAMYHLGQYKQAVVFLRQGLGFNPQHAETYRYLALCFEKLGIEKLAGHAKIQEEAWRKKDAAAGSEREQAETRLFYYPPMTAKLEGRIFLL